MTGGSYIVNLNDQDIIVRIAQTSFDQIRVLGQFPIQLKIMGGIPGPQGQPGISDSALLASHIIASEPHPVYDNMLSLTLLFENGLI